MSKTMSFSILGWQGAYKSSHFAPAFLFLSPDKRRALETLYAVCRVLDDAVDRHSKDPEGFLAVWKTVFESDQTSGLAAYGHQPLGDAFVKVMNQFSLPRQAMIDLIDKGVAVDLRKNRFQTPMETEDYCYGVAGTVGLACLPIFGVPVSEAKDFAIRLGITVQWINIIRDVGVDAKLRRIYLPLDHLDQFGYTEQDLEAQKKNADFQALMKKEAEVARSHYKRALELMPIQWKKNLLPARIMGRIYIDLLKKIEKKGFPVLERKIRLNFYEKLRATWTELKS